MCSFLYIGRINSSFYCFTCGTLVYYPDSRQCSVHLINKGVTIENNNATIEFTGTGPSEENVVSVFVCQLDGGSFSTCKNFKSYHKCQCYWHQLSVSTTATNWLLTLISPGQIQTLQLLKACIKAVGRKERRQLFLQNPVQETGAFQYTMVHCWLSGLQSPCMNALWSAAVSVGYFFMVTSQVTAPQDAPKRLILQVYPSSNTLESSAICE